jgi:hypothetical protein
LNQFIESNKEFSELKELATDDILVQIGIKLFNLLIESKLIKMNIEQIDKTHKIHVFTLTENVNELVSNSLTSFNLPSKIPMLTKPKKYI